MGKESPNPFIAAHISRPCQGIQGGRLSVVSKGFADGRGAEVIAARYQRPELATSRLKVLLSTLDR